MNYEPRTMNHEPRTHIGFTQIAAIAFPVIAVIFLWISDDVAVGNLTFDVSVLRAYAKLETNYLYLIINALSLGGPFLLSFDRRVHFLSLIHI